MGWAPSAPGTATAPARGDAAFGKRVVCYIRTEWRGTLWNPVSAVGWRKRAEPPA